MRRLAAVLALLLAAHAANAEEPQKSDYSREAVLRAFYVPPIELGPRPKPRVQFHFGAKIGRAHV